MKGLFRRARRWIACVVWHSDYSSIGMHRSRCEECGREWSE